MGKTQLYEFIDAMILPPDAKALARKMVKHLDEQPALLLLIELKDKSEKLAQLLEVMENSLQHTSSLKR
ncbi:hypothetical protein KKB41_03185 [Patescibacteria group bacterium]|nr:hypothetical protein [Patescibacteria group bacterium]